MVKVVRYECNFTRSFLHFFVLPQCSYNGLLQWWWSCGGRGTSQHRCDSNIGCSITRHLPAYYQLMTLHLQTRDNGNSKALTLIYPSILDICNEWAGGCAGGWCGNTCSRCINSSVSCVLPNYNYHHRPPAHQPALLTAHGHCHKLDQCKSINN